MKAVLESGISLVQSEHLTVLNGGFITIETTVNNTIETLVPAIYGITFAVIDAEYDKDLAEVLNRTVIPTIESTGKVSNLEDR